MTIKPLILWVDWQWQICLILLAFPALFFVSPASAVTAATGSLKNLGAVLEEAAEAERMTPRAKDAVVQHGDRAQVHKPVINGEDCDDPSQYKVDVGIFGENNLDDSLEDGIRNQCDMEDQSNLPSTGRFIVHHNGKDYQAGTGEAVGKNNIIVGAAHTVTVRDLPEEKIRQLMSLVVFRLWERQDDGSCLEVDYPVKDWRLHSKISEVERNRDQLVVLLERPLPSNYKALPLASNLQIERALSGELKVKLKGFPRHGLNRHETNQHVGKHIAEVSCERINKHPQSYKRFFEGLIQHDCDTWKGMSGGLLRVTEGGQDFFFGTHIEGAKKEGPQFNRASFYNLGVLLNDWMREAISDLSSSPTS